ncbi:MAG: hypothetical protein ACYTA3_10325 [Planctomycetota bacterium]
MLKLATIGLAGTYGLGVVVFTADLVINRFALNWGLGMTVVQCVIDSLDWPLWLLG